MIPLQNGEMQKNIMIPIYLDKIDLRWRKAIRKKSEILSIRSISVAGLLKSSKSGLVFGGNYIC